jgi:hypothetical protein
MFKIYQKKILIYKFWVFSKNPLEISNFLSYLDCPHYLFMNEEMWKKSWERKLGLRFFLARCDYDYSLERPLRWVFPGERCIGKTSQTPVNSPRGSFPGTSLTVSMTSLLTHNVAHSTRPSFRPKTNNQPITKSWSLAVSWVKVIKNLMSF